PNLSALSATRNLKQLRSCWTGAPCSPQRTWAENGFFPMLSLHAPGSCSWPHSIYPSTSSIGRGLRPIFFGPCTLREIRGTRPGKRASFFARGLQAAPEEVREPPEHAG